MIAVMKIREAQTFSDEVVDLLVQERIRQNISRYRLAKECGITEAALSYIERARTQADALHAENDCRHFEHPTGRHYQKHRKRK